MFCEKAREAPAKNKKNKPGRPPDNANQPAGRDVPPALSARRRSPEPCHCIILAAFPRRVKRCALPPSPRHSPQPRRSRQPSRLSCPCRSAQLSAAQANRRKLRPRGQSRAPAIVSSKSPLLPGLAGTKQCSPSIQATPRPHLTQRRPVVMRPPGRRRRLRHPGDLKGRTPMPRKHEASPRPAPGMTRPGPPPPRDLCSHAPISSRRRVRIMVR